jgi:hypothetical protein
MFEKRPEVIRWRTYALEEFVLAGWQQTPNQRSLPMHTAGGVRDLSNRFMGASTGCVGSFLGGEPVFCGVLQFGS